MTFPFAPGVARGPHAWSLLEAATGSDNLVEPEYETVEVRLPWQSDGTPQPLASCPDKASTAASLQQEEEEAEANLRMALQRFCDGGLGRYTEFFVDPRFEENRRRWSKDGWIESAFLTYMGLHNHTDKISGEEDLLVQSVHHFSKKPVVVANFGKRVPKSWSPERFPNLVLLHARSVAETRRSFNFNKHTAMLFSKIKSGLALDADQFANRGLDYLLERAAEETTKEYPFPIQPVHWMTRDPEASDMKFYSDEYKWVWQNPEGAPNRTMRWGHAHPTWSHHALPWLANWTSYVLAPHRFKREVPAWMVNQGWWEDEDLMNVALWASNATKQWCKYDIPLPIMFQSYVDQDGPAMYPDSKFYPKGIPLIFFTAHGAKEPEKSFEWLTKLWEEGDDRRKAINYDGKWFGSANALHNYDPNLRCIA